ncbi:MAG: hypothetical protein ACK4UN_13010, partial [Limisphaerales bacterium]
QRQVMQYVSPIVTENYFTSDLEAIREGFSDLKACNTPMTALFDIPIPCNLERILLICHQIKDPSDRRDDRK